jgi:ADP-heptose:LPS heptosyltransferase
MTILIYHTGALGDFVTVLPVLAALRAGFAGARLVLLGRKGHGEMAREAGLLDETRDIDGAESASLFAGRPSLEQMRRLERFDLALAFTSPGSPVIAALREAGVAEVRSQPPFPGRQVHVVDYHLELLEGLAPCESGAIPALDLTDKEIARRVSDSARANGRRIILHPGSGSPRKNWPLERFAELAGRMEESGSRVMWIRGPAERGLALPAGAALAAPSSPLWLARLLHRASLYVGNDSGVSHLAAACGCPAVVLFGPSEPAVWAPRGPNVRIVDCAPPCRPCHPGPPRPVDCRESCMARISVGRVLSACRDTVARSRHRRLTETQPSPPIRSLVRP